MLDTRKAATPEKPPTGNGAIVFEYVAQKLTAMILAACLPQALGPLDSADGLAAVLSDLEARAKVGREKYGTFLRVNNGRQAIVDLYQEVQDAIMYSAQARMEGDKIAGAFVESLIGTAAMLAEELNKRG